MTTATLDTAASTPVPTGTPVVTPPAAAAVPATTIPVPAPVAEKSSVPAAAVPAAVTPPAVTPPTDAAKPAAAVASTERQNSWLEDDKPAEKPADAGPEIVYDLKAPETADKAQVQQVLDFAKANRVAPETAQKLLDRELARTSVALDQVRTEAKQTLNKVWDQFEADAKADPEIGGRNYSETQKLASRALNVYGTPALRKMLKEAPWGAEKEVLRFLANVARRHTVEDQPHVGSTPPPADLAKDPISLFYGSRQS